MRCCSCHRNIAAGAEAQKMIVEYRQDDGEVRVHGYLMPDGPISQASGVLVRGWHSKCWWVAKKREAKGDAVTGRVIAGAPTGYDIGRLVLTREDLDALGITEVQAREHSTVQLSHQLARLREMAQSIGKGVGDAQVQEAFAAAERGGPYPHQHHHRLETYQLIAHLEYAHGVHDQSLLSSATGLLDLHVRLHAQSAQADIRARRAADNEPEPPTRDWRTQFTGDLQRGKP